MAGAYQTTPGAINAEGSAETQAEWNAGLLDTHEVEDQIPSAGFA